MSTILKLKIFVLSFKVFVLSFLVKFGLGVARYNRLQKKLSAAKDLEKLLQYKSNNAKLFLQYLGKSKSQIRQDLFVLSHLGFKKNGFFVEFGATDGLRFSNSHLMEKEFGWNGILAEPAKCWHKELKKNRACNIEVDCLWKDSKSILTFNEVDVAELSTINSFTDNDLHSEARKKGKTYDVQTISLNDLLKKYNAPKIIDYLSIDTEGSEYRILSHFDFEEYSFKVITCEHNFTPMREKIFSLLTQKGYQRVLPELSKFDDWYIKPTQQQKLKQITNGGVPQL
jgi:FkbM family methyltransferase